MSSAAVYGTHAGVGNTANTGIGHGHYGLASLTQAGNLHSQEESKSLTSGIIAREPPLAPCVPMSKAAQLRPAARPRRSRGCQHCISCAGLQHHVHSATVRSSHSEAAEWWPGGIHSPAIYFHLRARQLHHQHKHPPRGIQQWRTPATTNTGQCGLASRRRLAPLSILVPLACTNVPQADANGVQYVGEKVVPLPRVSKRVCEMPAIEASKKIIPSPFAFDSPPTKPSEPKRRCTEVSVVAPSAFLPSQQQQQFAPSLVCGTGHFIAPAAPIAIRNSFDTPSIQQSASPMAVYPGIVLQHSGPSSASPPPMFGVTTPPLGPASFTGAPLSAVSDYSSSSTIPAARTISRGSDGASGDSLLAMFNEVGNPVNHQQQQQQQQQQSMLPPILGSTVWDGSETHAGAHKLLTARRDGTGSTSSDTAMQVDPTMQQYYSRQYAIKQEQAFPCHRVIDLHELTSQSEEQQVGWSSMLRSLAGTLRRSMSP